MFLVELILKSIAYMLQVAIALDVLFLSFS